MANKDINRIKVVLVDKKKNNKWLTRQLGKDQTTISKKMHKYITIRFEKFNENFLIA